ncbi:prephenate dehydrogenase/arogenate dehydrogenase family protein [Candidatus Woesearchaeota archaeon]|nr:prephenate dehydrogenase/arogenate dehydrogenase family protein [Candidatus Woesearchaeota archaeon]
MKRVSVGIIGGTGKMGRFFKKFFEKNKCKVLVSSRRTRLKPTECAKKSDVVLVSVPIGATLKVIREISPCINKKSLLIDTTSIKKEPVNAMLKYSKCEAIGMHPVFGPNVGSVKNQAIVLCPARGKKWLRWIANIFEKNGAKIRIVTAKKHDEMMSIIQGLNHFSTLAVAHAMKRSGIAINESLEFASPVYRLRMMMVGRILNQNPELYADIEIMNSKNREMLDLLEKSSQQLKKIIESKNKREFVKYFNECSQFFGGFRKDAERTSDYLIEKMVEME